MERTLQRENVVVDHVDDAAMTTAGCPIWNPCLLADVVLASICKPIVSNATLDVDGQDVATIFTIDRMAIDTADLVVCDIVFAVVVDVVDPVFPVDVVVPFSLINLVEEVAIVNLHTILHVYVDNQLEVLDDYAVDFANDFSLSLSLSLFCVAVVVLIDVGPFHPFDVGCKSILRTVC